MTIAFDLLPKTSDQWSVKPKPAYDAPVATSPLAPLLAGAQARGMCDAFDLLCLNVVLLDKAGMVLHVNKGTRRLLGSDFYLVQDHLILQNQAANQKFLNLVGDALGPVPRAGTMEIKIQTGRLCLRVLPIDSASNDACQLLQAMVWLIPLDTCDGRDRVNFAQAS